MPQKNEPQVLETGALVQELDWRDPQACFATCAHNAYALWLDSADTTHKAARFSYIAHAPFETLTIKNGLLYETSRPCEASRTYEASQAVESAKPVEPVEPFELIDKKLAQFQEDWAGISDDWPVFRGGLAGYFAYDMAHYIERLPNPLGATDDAQQPDMVLGLYDCVLAFDHHKKKLFLFSTGFPEQSPAQRTKRALSRADEWLKKISALPQNPALEPLIAPPLAAPPQSALSAEEYQNRVQKIISYIYAGDIFQANLSHRFTARLNERDTAWDFYKRLRHHAPAPFAAFFQMGDWALASASMERFLYARHKKIETRPIKGTRPRHKDKKQDARARADLFTDEKERAENIMIVDLMRNDLSRICETHSIHVPQLCAVESFKNVHHLVSIITGTLKPHITPTDILKACFPGGSISGAPKIRAMEIIATLEENCRGAYCGAIGYIGFDGTLDCNIAIRTATIKGQNISFQMGGGITANSEPMREYHETLAKAKGIFTALGCAAVTENPTLLKELKKMKKMKEREERKAGEAAEEIKEIGAAEDRREQAG